MIKGKQSDKYKLCYNDNDNENERISSKICSSFDKIWMGWLLGQLDESTVLAANSQI